MARKRRSKPRKSAHERSVTSTMSSEDSYAMPSARQSTDDTLSDLAVSDGAHTAMTSIVDTDEYDEDDDIISIYPRSHYPVYRPNMPLSPGLSPSLDLDMAASTRSLWAQDLDYREIHGRRYCREYFMPNDEVEQMRLTLQHQVFVHALDDELTLAPLEEPTHILDVGTGTGDWAIRMAELHPQCEVVGTDIAAIAETRSVPMNVFFEIEDAEDWDRHPDAYDLVHFRGMDGAFKNWNFIYDNAFYSLKPGGWVETQDFDAAEGFAKFVDCFPPDSPMHEMNRDVAIGAAKSGRTRGTQHLEPQALMKAGFVDVSVTEVTIPMSVAEQSVGKIWLISCLDAVEAHYLRILTEQMGWDPEKCKAACEQAARDLADLAKNPDIARGMSVKLRVAIGRKPLDTEPIDLAQDLERRGSPSTEVVDECSPDPTLHAGDDETRDRREPSPVPREMATATVV